MNIVVAGACLLGFSVLQAGDAHSDPALQHLAQAFAEAGKDRSKLDAAFSVAEQTLKALPDNPVALVYKGSLSAQRAGAAFLPWKKLGYLREGMDLMDRALDIAAQPSGDSAALLQVRMVRALTNARIPSSFGRAAMARDDFTKVLASAQFKDMKAQDQASVHAWLAVYAHRDKQAEKAKAQLEAAKALDSATADAIWAGR